ncbi:hypothetical protein, partial, partial [Parasitella parasitica]
MQETSKSETPLPLSPELHAQEASMKKVQKTRSNTDATATRRLVQLNTNTPNVSYSDGYDILLLQETHATTQQIIDEFNIQFRTTTTNSSHWTQHCGIVCLNNKYRLQIISDGIDNGRYILANIQLYTTDNADNNTLLTIATILNIYGRSGIHSQRSAFYTELLSTPPILQTLTDIRSTPTIILGDFNYSYEHHLRQDGSLTSAPTEWINLLTEHYVDCFQDLKQPTWQKNSSQSILDFIFCDKNSAYRVEDPDHLHISRQWTDHALLGISFRFEDLIGRGPGAWKANPLLAKRKDVRSALANHIEVIAMEIPNLLSLSTTQQTWDWVKQEVKSFIKAFQLTDNNWRDKQLKKLQGKRNMMIRQSKNRGLYFQVLATIERQIGSLQESVAEVAALRAGKTWREKGEKDAGYLKRTVATREA